MTGFFYFSYKGGEVNGWRKMSNNVNMIPKVNPAGVVAINWVLQPGV